MSIAQVLKRLQQRQAPPATMAVLVGPNDVTEPVPSGLPRVDAVLKREPANDLTPAPSLSEADQELLIERMAVMQYDGGLPQADAERLAVAHTHYLLHHWGCKACCAAGQGLGVRCKAGAALWTAYESAAAR